MSHLWRFAMTLTLATAVLSPAAAQDYPTRAVKIIVPFGAGGPADIYARFIGQHLQESLKQTFVIENRPGAGSVIGTGEVAKSAPDGYTLLMMSNTHTTNETLRPNKPFQLMRDFVAVAPVNYSDLLMVVHPSVPAKDLKEFLAYLKDNSTKLSYGHAGVGSISYVSGTLFNSQFGLKPGLVAYRGTAPALTDLVGGQIDYMVDQSLNVIPQIKGNTIKAYAVAAPERLASLPDVPTTKEAGVDFIFSAWNALVGPKGLPKDVVAKLSVALNKALDDPGVVQRYAELGSTAPQGADRGPAGLQKLVESEMARITPVLKEALADAAKTAK